MKNSDSGYVYPHESKDFDGYVTIHHGMTRREYYAAMAMQGLLAAQGILPDPEKTALNAVVYADALIAWLDKRD